MKRTILIEILLLSVLAILIAFNVYFWGFIKALYDRLNTVDSAARSYIYDNINSDLPYGIIGLIACIATLTAIILIAIKDFSVFKPLVDKINARKEARNKVKVDKAEQAKQNKIEALEKQLEELKKE